MMKKTIEIEIPDEVIPFINRMGVTLHLISPNEDRRRITDAVFDEGWSITAGGPVVSGPEKGKSFSHFEMEIE
jgi:hypothetical protein